MHPVFFTIGQLQISGYWVMTVLGLTVCTVYMALTNRTRRLPFLPWYDFMMLCCFTILSIFIGGKLLGILVRIPTVAADWETYRNDLPAMWETLTSGRAFYGGLIMLLLVFIWYSKKQGLPGETLWALFTPSIPLFMVFGRLGCFFAGCCYGVEVPWGIVFPEGSLAPHGVALFPGQLAEAFGQLLLFIALAAAEPKMKKKWHLILWYLTGYGVMRFVLEFFRGDIARGVWVLSTSQWISIGMVVAVAVIAVTESRKHRRSFRYRSQPDR